MIFAWGAIGFILAGFSTGYIFVRLTRIERFLPPLAGPFAFSLLINCVLVQAASRWLTKSSVAGSDVSALVSGLVRPGGGEQLRAASDAVRAGELGEVVHHRHARYQHDEQVGDGGRLGVCGDDSRCAQRLCQSR